MKWYYFTDKQYGPFEHGDMLDLVKSGKLSPSSNVWNETFGKTWKPVSEVPELAPLPAEKEEPPADTTAPKKRSLTLKQNEEPPRQGTASAPGSQDIPAQRSTITASRVQEHRAEYSSRNMLMAVARWGAILLILAATGYFAYSRGYINPGSMFKSKSDAVRAMESFGDALTRCQFEKARQYCSGTALATLQQDQASRNRPRSVAEADGGDILKCSYEVKSESVSSDKNTVQIQADQIVSIMESGRPYGGKPKRNAFSATVTKSGDKWLVTAYYCDFLRNYTPYKE